MSYVVPGIPVASWGPAQQTRMSYIYTTGMCYPASAGPAGVVLLRPDFNTESMAEGVELDLKRRITAWREGNGWSTVKQFFIVIFSRVTNIALRVYLFFSFVVESCLIGQIYIGLAFLSEGRFAAWRCGAERFKSVVLGCVLDVLVLVLRRLLAG